MFRILVKDYVVAAYLSDRLFLAIGHIFIKDLLQRFLALAQPKKIIPYNIRLNSDDPCAPWIIQSALRGSFRVPSVDHSE